VRCLPALEKAQAHDDEAIGVHIVKTCARETIRQTLHRSRARNEGAMIVGRRARSKDENFGFHAKLDEVRRLRSRPVSLIRLRSRVSQSRKLRPSSTTDANKPKFSDSA